MPVFENDAQKEEWLRGQQRLKEKAPSARKVGSDKKSLQMCADRGDMDMKVGADDE